MSNLQEAPMKRISYPALALFALVAITGAFSVASATPIPNSAIVLERLYNDCPLSAVTSINGYPGYIEVNVSWSPLCVGFANGHAWNFSGDGGATSLNLGNNGNYKFSANVIITGAGVIEGGIHIAPWWN